jgi:predicted O-methyltransferase YrrM
MVKSRQGPAGIFKPEPVLAAAAKLLLSSLVNGADVWEFGSGGSTLWLARRANQLISIEDDAEWYIAVTDALSERGIGNAEVRLVETRLLPDAITGAGLFDLVFVDCLTQNERRRAVILGAQHVKPGGWLVADDYDFPLTKKAVDGLGSDWDVAVLAGKKIHPTRRVVVKTATAFCHRAVWQSA